MPIAAEFVRKMFTSPVYSSRWKQAGQKLSLFVEMRGKDKGFGEKPKLLSPADFADLRRSAKSAGDKEDLPNNNTITGFAPHFVL